VVPLNPGC